MPWTAPKRRRGRKKRGGVEAGPRLADTPPVREGRVYDNNRRRNAAGGSDFWESGVLRPDRVLADLVHIFHPELSETDELYYYRQLE